MQTLTSGVKRITASRATVAISRRNGRGWFHSECRVKANSGLSTIGPGLMVRIDENRWVKSGPLSLQIANGFSAQSSPMENPTGQCPSPFKELEDFYIRITLKEGTMRIQASSNGSIWPLLRLAPFPKVSIISLG